MHVPGGQGRPDRAGCALTCATCSRSKACLGAEIEALLARAEGVSRRPRDRAAPVREGGRQPLLRALDPHPLVVRDRRRRARRRTCSTGRSPAPRPRRASRCSTRCATSRRWGRRASSSATQARGAAELVARAREVRGDQRRRRPARAPLAGPARRVHPQAPLGIARGQAGGDRRRRAPQPGRPQSTSTACRRWAPRSCSAARATLLPCGRRRARGARSTTELDDALDGADAVMMLRVQRERQTEALFPSEREYHRRWGLTARARPSAQAGRWCCTRARSTAGSSCRPRSPTAR